MKSSFRSLIVASILSLSSMGCLSAPDMMPMSPAQPALAQQSTTDWQTRSDMNTTADSYQPLVSFLQENNMSLRDWNALSESYYSLGVIDQKSQIRLNFLQSLEELAQYEEPASIEDSIQNARDRRKLDRELRRLGQR